ncbi:MAG: NAD(P)-dependent oxidoreductase, partial [Omnitrophica bacterium]|nr:NAD(P)-dependent oxidoreductase [Candidatus Omnitrophota bacterium]
MRILVTGCEGPLAQIIIPYLLKAGHEVCGYDNPSRHGYVKKKRDYSFGITDLYDTKAVKAIFAGQKFDVVFHLAALVYGIVGFHAKPADIIVDSTLTTINLLNLGREAIGKFVYLSSPVVYERCTNFPHKEEDADSAPMMSTSYGVSKYATEKIIRSFHDQYNIAYVIWRPFNVITPFEAPKEEGYSHVFSDMIDKILTQKQNPVNVLGDG